MIDTCVPKLDARRRRAVRDMVGIDRASIELLLLSGGERDESHFESRRPSFSGIGRRRIWGLMRSKLRRGEGGRAVSR